MRIHVSRKAADKLLAIFAILMMVESGDVLAGDGDVEESLADEL